MGKNIERGKYSSPQGSRTWEYLCALCCATGTFVIGIATGWNSPSLGELMSKNSNIPITPSEASTLTACLAVGHLVAFPSSVYFVDKIGRKKTVLVAAIPMIINWVTIAIANSVWELMLARGIAGFAMGLLISAIPIYNAEILSSDIRGSLGAIGAVTAYCGVLFMFGITRYLGIKLTACWCIGFSIIFLMSFSFIPESPYFLVMTGRFEEAEAALEKLRGKTDVGDEIELIKATLREKGKSLLKSNENESSIMEMGDGPKRKSGFMQMFTIRGNLKSLLIGFILMIMSHFCGFQIILYYCHILMKDMGSAMNAYIASNVSSILLVISAGSTILFVDRFGRKPLLLFSGAVTVVLLGVITTYFFLIEHVGIDVTDYSMIPVTAVFLLVMALNVGVISVPGTIMSEIFSPEFKMLANCIIGFTGSLLTMCTTKSYLLIVRSWGLGHSVPFFGYTVITLVCIVLLRKVLPETKGKTLLEIQRLLNA